MSHSADLGGAERSLLDLVHALSKLNVSCHVVLPNRGPLMELLGKSGVPCSVIYYHPWCYAQQQSLWLRGVKLLLIHLARGVRLARTIRATTCDIVVTNTSTVCEGAIAAALLRIPHITHVREFGDPGYGLNYELGLNLSMRILKALSRFVVFNSRTLAQHFRVQVPASHMRVVYNAIHVPRFEPKRLGRCKRRDENFVCLLVGNIVPSKGHEDALRALRELVRRGRAVKLQIIGRPHPKESPRLEALVHMLGLAPYIEFVGHVTDPFSYYPDADAVLVCSRKEAFGRVTIEAMKYGCPVIAAAGGAAPEQIHDGINGALYPPGDFGALADRIEALMMNPDLASDMAARAQAWSTETFTLERYGAQMLAVLQEAIPELATDLIKASKV